MALCNSCSEFTSWIASSNLDTEHRRLEINPKQQACNFCENMMRNLKLSSREENLNPQELPIQLDVSRSRSAIESEQGLICGINVYDPRWHMALRLDVWSDKDKAACNNLISRRPILTPCMEDVCDLAQTWLDECNSSHKTCSISNVVHLPSRALRIRGKRDALIVKLEETRGQRGTYCALSHCWGPVEKQPLRTTRANLQAHLEEINFEQLPKTFAHAATLAHSIGYEYIWIDSLCIIQDDAQDWEAEAKKMGALYRDAGLVIVAAGATNSTEGLVSTDRPTALVRQVPYTSNGVVQGSFNIAMSPFSDIDSLPYYGHLNTRAWALQEWLLPQRLMFFMPGNVSWKCKTLELSERGNSEELGISELESWSLMLYLYSRRGLTHASDRLHALQGIAAEVQRTRSDQYLHEYGVWASGLHQQMLWRQVELVDTEVCSLNLPTWSWAAVGGSKIWCPYRYNGPFHYMTKAFDIDSSGALKTSGYITRCSMALRRVPAGLSDRLEEVEPEAEPESVMEPGEPLLPGYLVWDDASDEKVMGMIAFDRVEPKINARCLIIASTARKRYVSPEQTHGSTLFESAVQGSKEDSESASNPVTLEDYKYERNPIALEPGVRSELFDLPEDMAKVRNSSAWETGSKGPGVIKSKGDFEPHHIISSTTSEEEEHVMSRILHLQATTRYVYWALVLEPCGKADFKRVGIAMFYGHAFKALDLELTDIGIV